VTDNEQQLARFEQKIRAASMTHDDAADMFLLTKIGQSTCVSRAELLARLRTHFPDQAALNTWLSRAYLTAFRGEWAAGKPKDTPHD
jgi:hypothetical protein